MVELVQIYGQHQQRLLLPKIIHHYEKNNKITERRSGKVVQNLLDIDSDPGLNPTLGLMRATSKYYPY